MTWTCRHFCGGKPKRPERVHKYSGSFLIGSKKGARQCALFLRSHTRNLFDGQSREHLNHRADFFFKLYVVLRVLVEHAAQAGMKLLRSCSRCKLQNILRIDARSGNNRDAFAGRRNKRR